MFRSRAPRDAVQPIGWPNNLQGSRGQGPSLPRARTTRRTAKFLACCVRRAPGDGQAAHGRPGQQRPIRPLAASLASSCPISSPWPAAAGGGSGRMSRPSGRRPSSCDQCCSTAATELRRGRPQARWPTAMDGELGARGRAARPPGQPAGCRGARRRAPLIGTHTARVPAWTPAPVAAQVAGTRAAGSKTLAPLTVEEGPGYSERGQGCHRQPAPKLSTPRRRRRRASELPRLGRLLSLQQPLCGGEEQAPRDLWPLTLCGLVHLDSPIECSSAAVACRACVCVCVRCRVSHQNGWLCVVV